MQSPKNIFDDIAQIYDDILPSHVNRHYLEKRKYFISRFLRQSYRILDVGCGTGKLIAELSLNKGVDTYGCDSSVEMMKNIVNQDKIRVICCKSDYLAYESKSFDVVISVAVFHHLYSEEAVIHTMQEMVRVAKKGSKIIIWDVNPFNPYWFFLFKRVPHDKNIKRIVPLRKIILEAKKLNLTKIEVSKSGWVPDFAFQKILPFFKFFELILERLPLINLFSAHNVIVITK